MLGSTPQADEVYPVDFGPLGAFLPVLKEVALQDQDTAQSNATHSMELFDGGTWYVSVLHGDRDTSTLSQIAAELDNIYIYNKGRGGPATTLRLFPQADRWLGSCVKYFRP